MFRRKSTTSEGSSRKKPDKELSRSKSSSGFFRGLVPKRKPKANKKPTNEGPFYPSYDTNPEYQPSITISRSTRTLSTMESGSDRGDSSFFSTVASNMTSNVNEPSSNNNGYNMPGGYGMKQTSEPYENVFLPSTHEDNVFLPPTSGVDNQRFVPGDYCARDAPAPSVFDTNANVPSSTSHPTNMYGGPTPMTHSHSFDVKHSYGAAAAPSLAAAPAPVSRSISFSEAQPDPYGSLPVTQSRSFNVKKKFSFRRSSSDAQLSSTNTYMPGSYGGQNLVEPSMNRSWLPDDGDDASSCAGSSCADLSVGYESVDEDDLCSVSSAMSSTSEVSIAKRNRKVKGGLLGLTKAQTLENHEASSKQRAAVLCTAFELSTYNETALNKSAQFKGEKNVDHGDPSAGTKMNPKQALNVFKKKDQENSTKKKKTKKKKKKKEIQRIDDPVLAEYEKDRKQMEQLKKNQKKKSFIKRRGKSKSQRDPPPPMAYDALDGVADGNQGFEIFGADNIEIVPAMEPRRGQPHSYGDMPSRI